jgi:predicted membrane protein
MNNDIVNPNNPNKGKAMAGIILLAVGGLLLLRQFADFLIPDWLLSWPMILIACGLYFGAKHNFQKSSWAILLFLGIIFLFNDNFDDAHRVVWPLAIIGVGIWIILKRGRHGDASTFKGGQYDKKQANFDFGKATDNPTVDYTVSDDVPPKEPYTPPFHRGDDYLDAVSVFGGVNKTILSKNFKGGEIVNIFGGAELDFTQADINGRVVIDITQIFGGTKIIVPSNWQVVSDLAAVFAGVDDKRIRSTASANNDKVLVLTGTSIFAGVDIRSY